MVNCRPILTDDMDKRLKAVKNYLGLTLLPQSELQDLVYLAAEICQTPIAAINLVDDKMQYPVVHTGNLEETSCDIAFCNHTIRQQNILEIHDAREDVRFSGNPFVTGQPYVRFYAGIPLITSDGNAIGAFCVVDSQPKKLSERQVKSLEILSKQVMHRLEMEMNLQRLNESIREVEQNRELLEQAEIMKSAFYDSSDDYFLLLNKKFEIVSFNPAIRTFFRQRSIEPEKGDKILQYLATNQLPQAREIFQKAKSGETTTVEINGKAWGDTTGWNKFTISPTYNAKKQLIGFACIGYNIDQEKKQQEKIDLQNNILSQIAQLHAHQIRHPLTNILGIINILKEEDFKMTKEYLGFLETASIELDGIIRKVVSDSHKAA